jgi:hypothetical protein
VRTVAVAGCVFALWITVAPPNVDAHLAHGPIAGTAKVKLERATRNLAHVRYVCKRGAEWNRAEHCPAVPWLERVVYRLTFTAGVPEWPWGKLAACESGRRWSYNGSSGFDGGLQFHPGTWSAYRRAGEPAFAYLAPAWMQVRVAERVLAVQGWGAWPACSRKLGLR